MQKILNFLAHFFAILCVILFTLTFAIALVLVNVESRLFNAETYKDALRVSGIYEKLPRLIAEQLAAQQATATVEPPGAGFLYYLDANDWEILIATVFPPQDMRRLSEPALDQIFDFLNDQSDAPVVSLLPIKQSVQENSAQAIRNILASHPNCSVAELTTLVAEFTLNIPRAKGQLCNPPPDVSLIISSTLSQSLQTQSADMPDSIPINNGLPPEAILSNLDLARLVMRLSLLAPLVFLLLTGLLVARSWKAWLRWLGISLITGGVLSLLVGVASVPIIQFFLTAQMSTAPPFLTYWVPSLLDILMLVIQTVAFAIIIQSLAVVMVGAVMYFFGRDKRRPNAVSLTDEADVEPTQDMTSAETGSLAKPY